MAIHKDIRFRRHQDWKAKEKAKFVMKHIWETDEEWFTPTAIGLNASTHCKPCSCMACGNPRKWFGEKTRKEKEIW